MGNHTFSHRDLNDVSLEWYLADIARNQRYLPAYDRPDPYVGARGLSWIHRWGLAEGLEVVEEPREPDWRVALRREYIGR